MQDLEDEIWKTIHTNVKYSVSSMGRVKHLSHGVINPFPNQRGYLRIDLRSTDRTSGKVELVHRLIALAFIPNPNQLPQVNHKNGIKTDNRVKNLEWCTNLHNRRHAQRLGLFGDMKGDSSPARKLDSLQVRVIRRCIKEGMRYTELSQHFKVGKGAIKDINLRRTWSTLL